MARNPKPIGLTINTDGVRYIQLKKRGTDSVRRKGFLPLNAGIIDDELITDEEVFLAELTPWLSKERIKGKRVIIAIPSSQAIIRRISIASSNAKEIEQLIDLEVQTTLHLPFADPVYDYVHIGEPIDDQQEVMIFAAPRHLVDSYVRIVEEAGLKVEAVDLPALALARIVALKSDEESFDNLMLLDKQGDMLHFYLFSQGNPVLMRSLPLVFDAGKLLDGEVTTGFYWLADEIVTEIRRMLNFYQFGIQDGKNRIRRIVVVGDSPDREQLRDYLQESIEDVTVSLVYVGDSNTRSATFEYRVPLGLALKEG